LWPRQRDTLNARSFILAGAKLLGSRT